MDSPQQVAGTLEEALGQQILEEALQDVISEGLAVEHSDAHLCTLQRTAQVAAALHKLRLSSPAAGRDDPAREREADASITAAHFIGNPAYALGVSPADLLAEALPSAAERQAALTAALPALEAELQRRCRLVAAASGYGTDDYTGLPDHIRQLLATSRSSRAAQADAWRKALQRAQQAVAALTKVAQLLSAILGEHKLLRQKAADEAQAAHLHSQVAWLAEKLRLVELQLKDSTYSADVVPVLRQVAAEVEATVGKAAAQLKQAAMRLQQYQALGPAFLALAREHAGVMQAVEEAEYELAELEQFRQLAVVTG